jgi:hypothetical protein
MVDFITDKVIAEKNVDTLNYRMQATVQATTAGTLTLTTTSPGNVIFTGTTAGQIVNLGNATTLAVGHEWWVFNKSNQDVSIRYNSGTILGALSESRRLKAVLQDNSTSDGIWVITELQEATPNKGTILVALFADTTNSVSNKFLSTENINTSDNQPSIMPGKSRITTVTYSGNMTNATGNIEFRVNTTVGAAALTVTLNTGANKYQVFTGLSLDVNAGDQVNCKIAAGASNVAKPLVKCYF